MRSFQQVVHTELLTTLLVGAMFSGCDRCCFVTVVSVASDVACAQLLAGFIIIGVLLRADRLYASLS